MENLKVNVKIKGHFENNVPLDVFAFVNRAQSNIPTLLHLPWEKNNVKSQSKVRSSQSEHTVASPPCSIHLGKKFLIPNHSKVKSSQSEVQIGVSILYILPKILIPGRK